VTRFAEYNAAIASRSLVGTSCHEVLSPEGAVLATTEATETGAEPIKIGTRITPLRYRNGRISTRGATITITGEAAQIVPAGPGAIFHPDTRNRLRLSAGVTWAGNESSWPQATMVFDEVRVEATNELATIEATLTDTLHPVRSNLVSGFAFKAGDLIEDTVARILGQVYHDESAFAVTPTGYSLPAGSFEPGDDRYQIVESLLASVGHELVTDPSGLVITQPIPPTVADDGSEIWRYGDGGIPVSTARRIYRSKRPNGYHVEGGSFGEAEAGLDVIIWDRDPFSDGYFSGPNANDLPTLRFPFAVDVQQLTAAGYGQLRREGVGPSLIEFTTIPNPAMLANDMVELVYPAVGASGLFRVVGYDLPQHAETEMRVFVRGVYDPALGYVEGSPASPRGEGTTPTVLDDFERPDENLENYPLGDGSSNWVEHEFSWGVVAGKAIQRFDSGWSMAVWNTPMEAADQSTTIEICSIPAHRFLGPVARSSGEFDGYVALASADGVISLEVWLGGAPALTLGTYDAGGPVDGRDLTVKAIGTTISIELDAVEVLSVDDDRCIGQHVGMLAFGGSPPGSPSVESFNAS
jgi:hypothetical protein